ncbi:adenosylhomocysteinase [Candidatus Woesearchaeota archaeon]|nr:adenosylhomocysteinase [Candidatus Woesearchaeota archaeon]
MTGQEYTVKDLSLADQGKKNIEWAEKQMGALMNVRQRFARERPLKNVRVGIALHVTKETAVLVRTLIAGGADVAICSCNPLSTQDDVAASLAKEGVKVYAKKGQSREEYYENLRRVIAFKPQITIDDGCDLVTEIHKHHPELIPLIFFGNEETTTGIIRLKAMDKDKALKYPVLAINDLKTKHLFDNYYGTGQSTWDGIIRATNILLAGKTIVVCGYGPCGKGVALKARGLGADVIVCEVDPFKALQAKMDGYRVMPLVEAIHEGEIFVTVTGNKNVIDIPHMKAMKEGTILANAGHFDAEINMASLQKAASSQRRIRPFMDEFVLNEKKLFVLGEGRLINLAAAEGHPSMVMAMSFCGQALAVEYGLKNKLALKICVNELPKEIDETIAKLQLEALGVKIDTLTSEQKKYLESWQEGT